MERVCRCCQSFDSQIMQEGRNFSMNKEEYMKLLETQLEQFRDDTRKDIMEDYESHFEEARRAGHTDEEIIKSLGNIQDVIDEIREFEENRKKEIPGEEIMDAAKEEVSVTIDQSGTSGMGSFDNVLDQISKDYCQYESNQEKAIEHECGTNQQETGQEEPEKCNAKETMCGYQAIVVDGIFADVFVSKSGDDRLQVRYECNDKDADWRYRFYQYERDGIFYVGIHKVSESSNAENTENEGKSFLGELLSQIGVRVGSSFGVHKGNRKIFVELPEGFPKAEVNTRSGDTCVRDITVKELLVKSSTGDIKVENANIAEIDLKTLSGDIELLKISSKGLHAKTTSGDAKLESSDVEVILLESTSGDVEIEHVKSQKGKCSSTSGDVNILDIEIGDLTANSTSGDVYMEGLCSNFFAHSTSGDIEGELHSQVQSVGVGTGSGDIDLQFSQMTGAKIVTKAVSGDCDIRLCGQRSENKGSFVVGDGSTEIFAETISGDIKLRE